MRAREESAEAVVVKRTGETRRERRAEGQAKRDQPTDSGGLGEQTSETKRERQLRSLPEWAHVEGRGGILGTKRAWVSSPPPGER